MKVPTRERRGITVRGIVQGVGFRPYVYALARRHGLSGTVRNDAEGVRIEVEGAPEELERFVRALEEDAPPLAVVESVLWQPLATLEDSEFRIEESQEGLRRRTLVSPDVATCDDCLTELLGARPPRGGAARDRGLGFDPRRLRDV
jgi:hydrogenase maturation protein HypF